jgi:hypothetical protein
MARFGNDLTGVDNANPAVSKSLAWQEKGFRVWWKGLVKRPIAEAISY